jgi:hypothetical protein
MSGITEQGRVAIVLDDVSALMMTVLMLVAKRPLLSVAT